MRSDFPMALEKSSRILYGDLPPPPLMGSTSIRCGVGPGGDGGGGAGPFLGGVFGGVRGGGGCWGRGGGVAVALMASFGVVPLKTDRIHSIRLAASLLAP